MLIVAVDRVYLLNFLCKYRYCKLRVDNAVAVVAAQYCGTVGHVKSKSPINSKGFRSTKLNTKKKVQYTGVIARQQTVPQGVSDCGATPCRVPKLIAKVVNQLSYRW